MTGRNWVVYEADDDHTPEVKAKIAQGVPPSEKYRAEWISRVAEQVSLLLDNNSCVVLAISLRRVAHRELLRSLLKGKLDLCSANIKFFSLFIPTTDASDRKVRLDALSLLGQRQKHRVHGFANNPGTLPEQVETYEAPTGAEIDCVELDMRLKSEELVTRITKFFSELCL